jgi:hypothetical protein
VSERTRSVQEERCFKVNVLAITTENRLLLGMVIDEASNNRSPGLLRSKEFETVKTEHWEYGNGLQLKIQIK